MNHKEVILENIIHIMIIVILMTLCMGPICITYDIIKLKNYSYILIGLGFISLILYSITKVYNRKITILEEALYILFILSTMSIFGSENLKVSIFGFYNRYEGLLMIYSYYSFALLTSTIQKKEYKELILFFVLIIGSLNVFYGVFQVGIIPNKYIEIIDTWKYAKGFLGNSMNYALLMSICYFLSLGLLLEYKELSIYLRILLIIIFSIGAIISGSMSIIVTMIIVTTIVFLYKMKEVKKTTLIKLFACFIIILPIFFFFVTNNKIYKRDIKELITQTKEVFINRKIESNFATGRIHIWENVIKKSEEHLLFGVGIDNFYYSFSPRLVDIVSKGTVDKAHNDYLQKLLCEGVFSLSAYIVFLVCIVLYNYKSKDSIKKVLLLGFIAYVICISINISVIRVAPLFWLITGLLMNQKETKET